MREKEARKKAERKRSRVPASRYRVSQRAYHPPQEFVYDASLETRRVDAQGRIRWHAVNYMLSNAFAGRVVGVRRNAQTEHWDVFYRTFFVAEIDEAQHRLTRLKGKPGSDRSHNPGASRIEKTLV